jgi:8-amino-7-oxononanoate synthase
MNALDRSMCDSVVECREFNSVDTIDASIWNSCVPSATGLRHDVLKTFEHSKVNDLVCHYFLLSKAGVPVGKANAYETSMDFMSLDKSLPKEVKTAFKRLHPKLLDLSMVECGLFAMNGDGLVVTQASELTDVVDQVERSLHDIAQRKDSDLVVFRDVRVEQFKAYERVLSSRGYFPAAGFANAVIDIEWKTFPEYLESLNSKTRTKLKAALRIDDKFGIRIEISSSYSALAKEMSVLWKNVNASSDDYNREQLDEAFFFEAGSNLADGSEAILFYHGERLVAFMWNLVGTDDYHMADWGVDYTFPQYREANFYRAASVYSLKRAIELGKKRMQLGMTNYVPKKLLGARMQPLMYFTKHRKHPELSAAVVRMITDAIEQPDELDYYLSSEWGQVSMSAAQYKEIVNRKIRTYTHGSLIFSTGFNI